MTKFKIAYNPYLVECIFEKNGKTLSGANGSKFAKKSKERLQVFLGEAREWKGLPEEIAETCDDDEVEITFRGRKIDFDDLEYTFEAYQGDVRFSLIHEEAKNDADIMAELDKIFEELPTMKEYIPEFDPDSKEGEPIFEAYEESKNGIFEINVIATMSSGKSTLINSMLHTELLPSKNAACTAAIASILDNDAMEGYEAECFGEDGETVIHPRKKVTAEELSAYNEDEAVKYIEIEGSIPAIPSDKIRLCLCDTPGPNNARTDKHGERTQEAIEDKNAVILYVMNATQFGIKDDKNLLLSIAEEMKKNGKQSRDRFIFVVNKCDALDEQKGETLDGTLKEVRDYLAGFGIENPILLPTSARLALLIRKARNGEPLSRMERNDLGSVKDFVTEEALHFEDYATLTPTVKAKLKQEAEQYHAKEEDWDMEALIHTGVPAVEQTICEYIDKYAYPIKIHDAVKEIVGKLNDLNLSANFYKRAAESKAELKKVREDLKRAEDSYPRCKEISTDFKKKIDNFKMPLEEKEEKLRVNTELEKLTKPYDSRTKVDRYDADRLIEKFQGELEGFQVECSARLRKELEKELYKKGEEMLRKYSQAVEEILGSFEIGAYHFQEMYFLKKTQISDIDDIVRRNEQKRFRTETRWKKNPEREGFWGFFKFWKPWEISYTVQVEDGKDVNVNRIVVDIMSQFGMNIKENIHSLFMQAENEITEYKKVFCNNIDTLNQKIEDLLREIGEKTENEEALRAQVQENEEWAPKVADMEERIKNLLTF